MANQIANKNYWNFSKGIITETSPLLYPENASIDEANFVLNRDNSRQRRLGIDYEPAYTLVNSGNLYATLSPTALSTFKWSGVGGRAGLIYDCVQVSSTLYFFDASQSAQSSSLVGSVTLSASNLYDPLSYASIQGVLVVSSREIGPKSIGPVFAAEVVTSFDIDDLQILIRDLYGVEDGHAVDYRPDTLTDKHKYNLLNQGWRDSLIQSFYISTGTYPSNADIWHVAKDSGNVFQSSYLTSTHFGTTPAPRGHYIIDAFFRGDYRTGSSATAPLPDVIRPCITTPWSSYCPPPITFPQGISGLPADVEHGKIGCVTTYSGRIFYSGIDNNLVDGDLRSPHYSGMVFFSRLAESTGDLSKCYTEADLTSEEISDVIASDGGTINILEAYNIQAMRELSGALLVFAENGVWSISGTDKGFSATDFILRKVTDVGCLSASSIVVVEGSAIFYWTQNGIYSVSGNSVEGFVSTSISINTIQSLYDEIPTVVKRYTKGIYDPISKEARWLYTNSQSYNSGVNPYLFDRELILNIELQAFYVNTFDNTGPYAADYIQLNGEVASSVVYNVVIGVDSVVIGLDTVVATYGYELGVDAGIKYLTIVPNTNLYFTFSSFNNDSFMDWVTYNSVGKNYESYLITGHELLQDSMRNKAVEYIVFHFNRTETTYVATVDGVEYDDPSSCLVQTRFDFSDSSTSGKWSTEYQAYRLNRFYQPSAPAGVFDYGHSVITTKNKVRGKGRAISYKIRSEQGKNMHILGWGVQYSGNSTV